MSWKYVLRPETVSSASHPDSVTIPKSNIRGHSNFMCIAQVIKLRIKENGPKMLGVKIKNETVTS